jgi:hypothetical protein
VAGRILDLPPLHHHGPEPSTAIVQSRTDPDEHKGAIFLAFYVVYMGYFCACEVAMITRKEDQDDSFVPFDKVSFIQYRKRSTTTGSTNLAATAKDIVG